MSNHEAYPFTSQALSHFAHPQHSGSASCMVFPYDTTLLQSGGAERAAHFFFRLSCYRDGGFILGELLGSFLAQPTLPFIVIRNVIKMRFPELIRRCRCLLRLRFCRGGRRWMKVNFARFA